jgi:hypothetical protein
MSEEKTIEEQLSPDQLLSHRLRHARLALAEIEALADIYTPALQRIRRVVESAIATTGGRLTLEEAFPEREKTTTSHRRPTRRSLSKNS